MTFENYFKFVTNYDNIIIQLFCFYSQSLVFFFQFHNKNDSFRQCRVRVVGNGRVSTAIKRRTQADRRCPSNRTRSDSCWTLDLAGMWTAHLHRWRIASTDKEKTKFNFATQPPEQTSSLMKQINKLRGDCTDESNFNKKIM